MHYLNIYHFTQTEECNVRFVVLFKLIMLLEIKYQKSESQVFYISLAIVHESKTIHKVSSFHSPDTI